MLGWEEQEEEVAVQTNQYVISSGGEVVLLDPGGAHVFPRVLANVAEMFELKDIRHIFYSHQDPDVSSGITLWLSMAEKATVYISGLWVRFLPHFGIYDVKRIKAIPDKGETLSLSNGKKMTVIPSHFLHSTGCFSLYDPTSKILFSGDIGAAIFPRGTRYPV
ncbi:MAG: MBL fold metallo-hydrolase, partial [Synergistaceae bacterium]|nr:MBL fold metallo-hydrolase [Synergistaceae bacterium]